MKSEEGTDRVTKRQREGGREKDTKTMIIKGRDSDSEVRFSIVYLVVVFQVSRHVGVHFSLQLPAILW